jgi:ribosome maturation factor RimP
MTPQPVVEQVKTIIAPIVAAAQLELVDVEFKREGQTHYLRIFIDKLGGVTLDDCQAISRECDVLLDVEDLIHTPYVLEVSSPGLDRPLRTQADYRRFLSHLVKIKTYRALQGQKKFLGYLHNLIEATAAMPCMVILRTVEDEEIQIPYEEIASARLEVEF